MEYLTAVAQAEGLDLQARRCNPTGQGIHNKMVLAQVGGKGWAVAGSLNGGEVSAKLNREMALLSKEPEYRHTGNDPGHASTGTTPRDLHPIVPWVPAMVKEM